MHGPNSFLAQAFVKCSVFSNFLQPPNFISQGWRMVLLVHLKGEIQNGKRSTNMALIFSLLLHIIDIYIYNSYVSTFIGHNECTTMEIRESYK